MLEAAIEQHEPTEKIIQVLRTLCDYRSEAGRFAVEAAPYCHSRKATLTVSGDPDNPLVTVHKIERTVPTISHTEDRDTTSVSALN
jgi:hypothetical protein